MRFTSCWCMCRVCHFWAKSPFIVSRVKKKSRLACWRRKSEPGIASSSSGRFHILVNLSPCRLRLMVYRGHFEDEFDDKNKQFQLNVEQKMMKNEIDIAQKACIRVSTVAHPFHADTEHVSTHNANIFRFGKPHSATSTTKNTNSTSASWTPGARHSTCSDSDPCSNLIAGQ